MSFNPGEGMKIVQRHVEHKTEPLELHTKDGGPLYFALLSEKDSLSANSAATEQAKNVLQMIAVNFPVEVAELADKPFAEVQTELEKLKLALPEYRMAA